MNFIGPMDRRPRYHANDTSRDILELEPHRVEIENARRRETPPSLEVEGYAVFPHRSEVGNFRDPGEVERVHVPEIHALLLDITGADAVVMTPVGILRFGERAPECGTLDNSRPARFVHIDVSDATAKVFSTRSAPAGRDVFDRVAHYNVWRALTPPPQDVPLAVCDARTLSPSDLVAADAVFDVSDRPEWSFEGLLIRYNAAQRWAFFPDMRPDEALVFKTHDTDPGQPHHVAHSAFDDPACPPGVAPRVSIEMRGIAYWYSDPETRPKGGPR